MHEWCSPAVLFADCWLPGQWMAHTMSGKGFSHLFVRRCVVLRSVDGSPGNTACGRGLFDPPVDDLCYRGSFIPTWICGVSLPAWVHCFSLNKVIQVISLLTWRAQSQLPVPLLHLLMCVLSAVMPPSVWQCCSPCLLHLVLTGLSRSLLYFQKVAFDFVSLYLIS